MRGISTFGAGQGALVLIDGVEGNLNTLDPEDIESFSILKDASSTAVYGVRGANGVVLVSTKKGKAGKLNLQVKANAGYLLFSSNAQICTCCGICGTRQRSCRDTWTYSCQFRCGCGLFRNHMDPVFIRMWIGGMLS